MKRRRSESAKATKEISRGMRGTKVFKKKCEGAGCKATKPFPSQLHHGGEVDGGGTVGLAAHEMIF